MRVVISAALFPCCAISAASMTRSPIPVERFAESITVTRFSAFSSSAARRITFMEDDIPDAMAKQGKSATEITTRIEELKPLVRASFVVDTLTYLYRGGRCSGLAALAGGALKLHPRIGVEDGKMGPGKKYRGNMEKVVLSYVKDMEEAMKNARPERVFITHSGSAPEIVDKVRAYLNDLHVFREILETRAGGVVSSHCGPGTLGVLFIAKE